MVKHSGQLQVPCSDHMDPISWRPCAGIAWCSCVAIAWCARMAAVIYGLNCATNGLLGAWLLRAVPRKGRFSSFNIEVVSCVLCENVRRNATSCRYQKHGLGIVSKPRPPTHQRPSSPSSLGYSCPQLMLECTYNRDSHGRI